MELKWVQAVPPAARGTFLRGVRAGIPIAVGYLPIAIAFGLLAKSVGIPSSVPVMMSLFIFAGASQFIGVNLLFLGVSHWEIIMTTFIINFRHFLMTAAISHRVQEGTSRRRMALLAFGVTDETFSVASLQTDAKLSPSFILGLNLIAYSAWNIGTWLGVFLLAGFPQSVQSSMGIALYSMFLGLLVPSLRKSRPILIVSLMAAAIHSILHWIPGLNHISTGWSIIIATILSALFGSVLFPKGVEE